MAVQVQPSYQKAKLSEFENAMNGVGIGQMRAARASSGDMPLVVLTRGSDPGPNPAAAHNPGERIQRTLWQLHSELAGL